MKESVPTSSNPIAPASAVEAAGGSAPPVGTILYENPLGCAADLQDFVVEGAALWSFPRRRLRLESAADAEAGQAGNYVLWLNRPFPDHLEISFDFWPIHEPALCMLFFAARGRQGQDIFDPALAKRSGQYLQYHSGDLNALHVSWWRRRNLDTPALHTCNLRKSAGFHLVGQGPDPLPSARDARGPYRIRVIKSGPQVRLLICDLLCLHWVDPGTIYGPVLGGGWIGLRQMTPTIAEYANLKIYSLAN